MLNELANVSCMLYFEMNLEWLLGRLTTRCLKPFILTKYQILFDFYFSVTESLNPCDDKDGKTFQAGVERKSIPRRSRRECWPNPHNNIRQSHSLS